jgi:hypothetical protein
VFVTKAKPPRLKSLSVGHPTIQNRSKPGPRAPLVHEFSVFIEDLDAVVGSIDHQMQTEMGAETRYFRARKLKHRLDIGAKETSSEGKVTRS